ncbi:hypothetical protein B0T16DRAFT_320573 [Cercophora newfieldiana]|uniref:Uncharacterized protein n=1 Tax=Cercophora newfieldiana TaxID=92897 RepID=A0AA40CVH1_9PEZI|nr:hypothetical protein B0T16DRAFT_320573 [Cercophora newfieldiana]
MYLGRGRVIKGCTPLRGGISSRGLHLSSVRGTADTTSTDASPTSRRLPIEVDSENKTVKTAIGELPLSPLMDPEFHEQRSRFTKRKQPEKPYLQKSKFRKQLERNPYAQALATPPRWCSVTKTVHPRFFLQRFQLVAHPETGDPWWVAQGFEKKSDTSPPPTQKPTGPSAYILSNGELLESLTTMRSPLAGKHKGMMRQTLRHMSPTMQFLNRAIWRDDMGPFLLEILRRRVVDELLYFADKVENADRRYLIKCDTWEQAKQYNHRGCLLYFGEALTTEPTTTPGPEPLTTTALPRLSALTIENVKLNGKLAVHNMQDLLSEPHLHRLKTESTLFRDGSLFLLGRKPTIDLQLLLWKLQGYLPQSPAPEKGETAS